MKKIPMHFVCTLDQAKEIIADFKNFWVMNCGCREEKGDCKHSRIDVCLNFVDYSSSYGSILKNITRYEVEDILKEAKEKHLVPRPFRDETRKKIDGICFCCDDCCGYFLNHDEICDKSSLIESTNLENCTLCGICEDYCYFNARKIKNDKLKIDQDNCYGCGLCVSICPEDCIKMIGRN